MVRRLSSGLLNDESVHPLGRMTGVGLICEKGGRRGLGGPRRI